MHRHAEAQGRWYRRVMYRGVYKRGGLPALLAVAFAPIKRRVIRSLEARPV